MRPRLMLAAMLVLVVWAAGCADDTDDAIVQPSPTVSPAAPTASDTPVATSTDQPTAEPTTAATTAPTTGPTDQPAPAPTTRPPVEPTPLGLGPGWTGFTTSDGLPGDDVVTVDVNPDGTIWAMVALDRQLIDFGFKVDNSPGRLAFARYGDGTWTTLTSPDELDGPMALAAGPAGTAWVVGGGDYFGNAGEQYGGTPGVWHFDGEQWAKVQGDPEPGEPLPIRAQVGSDGILWSSGFADVVTSTTGVFSHDTQTWTINEIPEHHYDCIDCHRLYVGPDNTVWIDYVDLDEDTGEQPSFHARLDGDAWTTFSIPVEVFDVPETRAGVRGQPVRGLGSDGIYTLFVAGGINSDSPGVPLPETGDRVPFAFVTFDGATWSEITRGELTVADGHTINQSTVVGTPKVGGVTDLSAAHHDDTLFIAGLGGLHLIDSTGNVTTLTTGDGLASNTTRHVTVGPRGALWVATDAGISVLVPQPR